MKPVRIERMAQEPAVVIPIIGQWAISGSSSEILEGVPYDTQADMWSLGVIVYILRGGYPPFIEQNQRELFRKIRKGQFEFHEGKCGGTC